jgi:hypothetical protein
MHSDKPMITGRMEVEMNFMVKNFLMGCHSMAGMRSQWFGV